MKVHSNPLGVNTSFLEPMFMSINMVNLGEALEADLLPREGKAIEPMTTWPST